MSLLILSSQPDHQPSVVVPVDPLEGGVLHLAQVLPGPLLLDQFSLVKADDGFGQRIVERVHMDLSKADEIQRGRSSDIAKSYDSLHDDPEHEIALRFLAAMLDFAGVSSVSDVGSGTGRAMTFLKSLKPELRVVGVEPVEALREAAFSKGIKREDLIDGDGYNPPFSEGEFDLVCEIGVLHHVREPSRVVKEMLRVADRGIFISDNNNFGGGSPSLDSLSN